MTRLLPILLFCVFFSGCDKPTQNGLIPPLPAMTPVDIDAELRKKEPLLFQSWAGLHQGFDADTHVTLHRNGKADIAYGGYALNEIFGTWKSVDGRIEIAAPFSMLEEMPGAHDWPPLLLKRGGGKLYLYPARETDALAYPEESAWPLGEIDTTDRPNPPSTGVARMSPTQITERVAAAIAEYLGSNDGSQYVVDLASIKRTPVRSDGVEERDGKVHWGELVIDRAERSATVYRQDSREFRELTVFFDEGFVEVTRVEELTGTFE